MMPFEVPVQHHFHRGLRAGAGDCGEQAGSGENPRANGACCGMFDHKTPIPSARHCPRQYHKAENARTAPLTEIVKGDPGRNEPSSTNRQGRVMTESDHSPSW